MTALHRLPIILILEGIAIEIGLFTYNALRDIDHSHGLLGIAILCLAAAIVGAIVTRPRGQAISCAILLLSFILLGVGFLLVTILDYRERASVALGIGILCLIGSMAGLILPRLLLAVLSNILAFGIITLGIGLYLLSVKGYHEIAYLVLAIAALSLISGLAGIIVALYKERQPPTSQLSTTMEQESSQ